MGRRRMDRSGMDLRGNPKHEATGEAPIRLDPLFRAHLQEHLEGGRTFPLEFGQTLPVEVRAAVQSQELPAEFADLRVEKNAGLVLAEVHRVVHGIGYDSTFCNHSPPLWRPAGSEEGRGRSPRDDTAIAIRSETARDETRRNPLNPPPASISDFARMAGSAEGFRRESRRPPDSACVKLRRFASNCGKPCETPFRLNSTEFWPDASKRIETVETKFCAVFAKCVYTQMGKAVDHDWQLLSLPF